MKARAIYAATLVACFVGVVLNFGMSDGPVGP